MNDQELVKCAYRQCERPALKGWTTCSRHYSAGRNANVKVRREEVSMKEEKKVNERSRLAHEARVLASADHAKPRDLAIVLALLAIAAAIEEASSAKENSPEGNKPCGVLEEE